MTLEASAVSAKGNQSWSLQLRKKGVHDKYQVFLFTEERKGCVCQNVLTVKDFEAKQTETELSLFIIKLHYEKQIWMYTEASNGTCQNVQYYT